MRPQELHRAPACRSSAQIQQLIAMPHSVSDTAGLWLQKGTDGDGCPLPRSRQVLRGAPDVPVGVHSVTAPTWRPVATKPRLREPLPLQTRR